MQFLETPIGLAPDADWMLSPLPWAWQHLLPLAADKVVGRLFLVGGVSVATALLFIKGIRWPKAAAMFLGLTACMVGAYFLGDASYQYVAARSIASVASSDLAQELRANSGRYNAWTFVCWWGGLAALALGVLMMAVALLVPGKALEDRL
ncbi:hypothetical protein LP416_08550 [Polaromonas sp. P2-4]|nr:hypothetical protein LP416_08550 [Polaromonas sp. P2-4]